MSWLRPRKPAPPPKPQTYTYRMLDHVYEERRAGSLPLGQFLNSLRRAALLRPFKVVSVLHVRYFLSISYGETHVYQILLEYPD